MYRHFAVITLALTAGIALFADGESRAEIAQRAQDKQRETELRRESYERFGAPKLKLAERPKPVGRFGDDASVDRSFGAPMRRPAPAAGSLADETPSQIPGFSQAYLDSLSEEERRRLLAGLEENGMLSDAQRQAQSASLLAASAARSGVSTGPP